MSRISFLFGARDRQRAVADWLGQAQRNGRQVAVFHRDLATLEHWDRWLWCESALGFLPHARATAAEAAETPIVLTSEPSHISHGEALLNLDHDLPPGFERFAEVVEVISLDESDRAAGRERFRRYRELGHPVATTDLGQNS